MLRNVVALLAFALPIASAHAATSEIVRNAAAGFIIPGYEQFASEAELEAFTIDRLCSAPSAANLSAAQDQFRALVLSWSRMEAIRFGPAVSENRLERILFWPDRKSTGLKQVQAAIAKQDETATSLESLRKKSVAMQGLGALEYTLFGTGVEDLTNSDGAYRCAYARTIAQALNVAGTEIANDWLQSEGIAQRMSMPKPAYADYRSEDEVLQELVGIYVHGAELLRDTRIKPFFAETAEASKYKSALYWRSNMTIASMRANVEGLRDLFIISGLADSLGDDARWVAGSFVFEMENFANTAGEITQPINEAVNDTQSRSKINYLLILTRSLQKLATEQIAAELGLTVGFSALDGD